MQSPITPIATGCEIGSGRILGTNLRLSQLAKTCQVAGMAETRRARPSISGVRNLGAADLQAVASASPAIKGKPAGVASWILSGNSQPTEFPELMDQLQLPGSQGLPKLRAASQSPGNCVIPGSRESWNSPPRLKSLRRARRFGCRRTAPRHLQSPPGDNPKLVACAIDIRKPRALDANSEFTPRSAIPHIPDLSSCPDGWRWRARSPQFLPILGSPQFLPFLPIRSLVCADCYRAATVYCLRGGEKITSEPGRLARLRLWPPSCSFRIWRTDVLWRSLNIGSRRSDC